MEGNRYAGIIMIRASQSGAMAIASINRAIERYKSTGRSLGGVMDTEPTPLDYLRQLVEA